MLSVLKFRDVIENIDGKKCNIIIMLLITFLMQTLNVLY